jgi:hypothetical protein
MTFSIMTLNAYAECHYAECHNKVHYAECCYAQCRHAECRGAVAVVASLTVVTQEWVIHKNVFTNFSSSFYKKSSVLSNI